MCSKSERNKPFCVHKQVLANEHIPQNVCLPLSCRCWPPSSAVPPASWLVRCWPCYCLPWALSVRSRVHCLRRRERDSNIPNIAVHPQCATDEDKHYDIAGMQRGVLVTDTLCIVTCLWTHTHTRDTGILFMVSVARQPMTVRGRQGRWEEGEGAVLCPVLYLK